MTRIRLVRNIILGIKTLMLHKLRSLLTTVGVVLGVASVIAMLAIGEGASAASEAEIRKLGSTNIIINSVQPTDQEAMQQNQRVSIYGLLYEDNQRAKLISTVERTAPARQLKKSARIGDQTLDMRIVGTTPAWFDLVQRPVIAGRTFNEQDMERMAPVCVLTEQGARELLATHNTIGQTVRIEGHMFEVIGIVESQAASIGGAQTPDRPTDAYIPLNTCRSRFGELITEISSGNMVRELVELHQIIVEVDEEENVEDTADALRAMLDHFHPHGDYSMDVPLALLRQQAAQQRIWNWTLGFVAGISLLVGGIGIMNIMLASVTERTREIGIRRAIGAKRRQIVGQFLIETIVLSATGGVIGIAAGPALAQVLSFFSNIPTIVPLYSIILSVGISMTIGIVFGIYPAIRAANLDPITALRHE